ncbi:MAG: N-acetylmuramoyl-L-alanine amidase, partial [Mycoplasmatota bacterium]
MEYKVVIDAGHGGSDPGAVGETFFEKEYTLKISQVMYDKFNELGVSVYMTRDTDETLDPEERVSRVLSAFGNGKDVVVISNHINAGG